MPVLLERTRPSKDQLKALYAYIRRQREKGKQALAESKAKEEEEKQRKREEEKKKETVEDVKKEIAELEAKLERLKQQKHDLFNQFKKALNYEDEIRKQQEMQAMKAASVHVASSRGVQGLPAGQGALTTSVHQQSALVDAVSSSGVIKRQGSPPHPLSGFIQAQITHSQKIQGLQPAAHVPGYPQQHPVQPTQVHPPAQDRFSGFQHGQGQTPVLAGSQPESRLPGKQHIPPLAPTGAALEPQPSFTRQPPLQQGTLPQQENQQAFSSHQLQQQHQQQFPYHMQQQQSSYQQYAQHGNQKQAFPTGPRPQSQQQPSSAQHNQGAQLGYAVQHTQDQGHLQSYHGSNVHQSQPSYQVHSQPQGYQAKPPATYQAQQVPMSGQHTYHPQQQQQQPLPPGQYPAAHGHQGQQDEVHRQQTMVPQQYQQQQGSSLNQGRQAPPYESTHQSQQMPPPQQQQQQQQQQQHQKQEQRPGAVLGYSQHYTHDYQQHHPQGSQSVKRASHKFNPYPYSGSKGHHQGSTGKKYPGKYQSSVEGTSSSGSYTGPSGSSSHSRHHHQGRRDKAGTGYSSSSQQKPSRYYQ